MTTPTPPDAPEPNLLSLPPGTPLHRIHDGRFGSTQFNPNLDSSSRFAPFTGPDGSIVPTIYAGESFACAAFETVFHDIAPDAAYKAVALSTVARLHYSTVTATRPLRLARLFEPDLNKWALTRSQLIDTPASSYPATRLWAQALHKIPGLDGMAWTSKRCDPYVAYVLFGDRFAPGDLVGMTGLGIMGSGVWLEELRSLGASAGILLPS